MFDDELQKLEAQIQRLITRNQQLLKQKNDLEIANSGLQVSLRRKDDEIRSLKTKIDISVNNIDKKVKELKDWAETKKKLLNEDE